MLNFDAHKFDPTCMYLPNVKKQRQYRVGVTYVQSWLEAPEQNGILY